MRTGRRLYVFLMLAALSAGLGGCLNNIGTPSTSSKRSTNSANSQVFGGGTPGFVLSNVVKNSANPTQILDLIGDGSGTFGTQCQGGGCACRITYTVNDTENPSVQSFDQAVSYFEANLARCDYTPVPPQAQNLKIRLVHATSNKLTNEMAFSLVGGGGVFDVTQPENFALVTRYQCRHFPNISYALGPQGMIYDPRLSEDSAYTYPLDFYTSNPYRAMAEALQIYSQSRTSAGWECPPTLNDPAFGTNLKLFSAGALPGTNIKVIYPTPAGIRDRHTFYLSKLQAGIYSEPVAALTIPGEPRTPRPVVGYAAKATVIAPGVERCPSSTIQTPPGYTWGKLWLFRADLPPRRLPSSQRLTQVTAIACDPGITNATTPAPARGCHAADPAVAFADGDRCGLANYNDATQSCTAGRPLVDRVLASVSGSGQCFALPGARAAPAQEGGAAGSEAWTKKVGANLLYTCDEVAAGRSADPLGVCRAATNPIAPIDTQVLSGANLDAAQQRYDFLFVVSDPSVNTVDLQNITSPVALAHTPVRFFMESDCPGNDPDAANCNPQRRINYGLKLHDLNGNGDPPANDPRRGGTFPLCVLQRSL